MSRYQPPGATALATTLIVILAGFGFYVSLWLGIAVIVVALGLNVWLHRDAG